MRLLLYHIDNHLYHTIYNISVRQRIPGEIVPVSAEHSRTYEDDEERFRAQHAIDLNWRTESWTAEDSVGDVWLKLTLDKVYCIQTVRGHIDLDFSSTLTNLLVPITNLLEFIIQMFFLR